MNNKVETTKQQRDIIQDVQKWIMQVLRQKRLVLTEDERNSTFVDYLPVVEDNEMLVIITAGTKTLGKRRFKYQWREELPWQERLKKMQ